MINDKTKRRDANGIPILSTFTSKQLFVIISKPTKQYAIENDILLFEFRSLYKLLDIEQNNQGIQHISNKITLQNLQNIRFRSKVLKCITLVYFY